MNGENWIESQKQRLLDNSEAHGEFGCLLCKLGGGKAVYSTLTVTFPWKKKIKKTVSSHRFAYMLHTKTFDLSSDMQVSHRCHNRRCVNIDHLSYEPPNVNQDRQIYYKTVDMIFISSQNVKEYLFLIKNQTFIEN